MIDEKLLIEELSRNSIFEKVTVGEETVYDVINRLPKVGEWIPCSERMPQFDEAYFEEYGNNKEYIVMIERAKQPTTLYFSSDGVWYCDNEISYKVVAWMELPDPYIEKPEAAAGCRAEWKDAVMRHFEKVE